MSNYYGSEWVECICLNASEGSKVKWILTTLL